MPPLELSEPDGGGGMANATAVPDLVAHGDLEIVGRVRWSSNATFLARVTADGDESLAIYKPRRGERPLWDFPTGTLCEREVAAYRLSEALGWGLVPPTVLRDGPVGVGMVQQFVPHDPEEHYFTLLPTHAERFRRMAVFDVLINNTDRKGGHCLLGDDGAVWSIDHGLAFHPAWKLRTVIWDFAGEPIDRTALDGVCRVAQLDRSLRAELEAHLSSLELDALAARAGELAADGRLPQPDAGYHSTPWPLV